MQTNMSLVKRLEETITNTTTGSPPQTPQEKQTAVESFETLAPSQAFRPSGKDEFVSLGLRMSKSESMFHNQSSVETVYVSPLFKTVSPEKETRASEDVQTPVQSRICWMEEDVSLKPLAMRGECAPKQVNNASENALQRPSVTSLPSVLSLSPPPTLRQFYQDVATTEGLLGRSCVLFIKWVADTSSKYLIKYININSE